MVFRISDQSGRSVSWNPSVRPEPSEVTSPRSTLPNSCCDSVSRVNCTSEVVPPLPCFSVISLDMSMLLRVNGPLALLGSLVLRGPRNFHGSLSHNGALSESGSLHPLRCSPAVRLARSKRGPLPCPGSLSVHGPLCSGGSLLLLGPRINHGSLSIPGPHQSIGSLARRLRHTHLSRLARHHRSARVSRLARFIRCTRMARLSLLKSGART